MKQLSYDVFLSYARMDDENNQFVAKLAKEMERAFLSLTGRPLRIFLDTRAITTAQVWEERLRAALDDSTVMVAVLTPRYFISEWCGREWDHFLDQELQRRREIGLPSSESLIFPVQFVSLDKVWRPSAEAKRRMSEAMSRQAKNLIGIEPESSRFVLVVRELVADIADTFILLDQVASANDRVDPTAVSAPAFRAEPSPGPHISTRMGDEEVFIDRLSEAANVTILGITHNRLSGYLDEALRRKRLRHGRDAFWSSIRVVFASESLLHLVHDELDADYPSRSEALRHRFQQAGQGRRAVASFFLLCNQPHRWSLHEYPYLVPFVGALFEMSDGSKVAQVATLRPSYRVDEYLFLEFAGLAGELAYYQAAFEDVVGSSEPQNDVTFAGVPNEREPGFICLGSRFRRSVMLPGMGKPTDWLPLVLIATYWSRSEGAEPLLQTRTRDNSNHEVGRLAHVSAFINQRDHGEFELTNKVEFVLPESAIKNAALRTLREELGLMGDNWELELVDHLRYHAASHESLYFFTFALGLPHTVSAFPDVAQLRPWALSDLLRLRRYQLLCSAERLLVRTVALTAWQADLVGRLLRSNLILHDLEELGERLVPQLYRTDVPDGLLEEIRALRDEASVVAVATGGPTIKGLGRLQYREFFSRLLPLYERIGVPGASDELDAIGNNAAKRSASDQLARIYASEPEMRNLPIEV
jgi:hypothetical protein